MQTIVKMVFGSHLYGTNSASSDQDFKGVFLPTREQLLLQRVPKSISTSPKKAEGVKNTAEDVDSEMYSLHYFLHLALEGETVALDMLHAPESALLETHPLWKQLVTAKHLFYTKNLKSFVGYARRQAAKYGVKGSRLSDAKRVLEFLEQQSPSLRLRDVWEQLPKGEHLSVMQSETDLLYNVCGKMLSSKAYTHHYIEMLSNFVDRYGARAKQAELNEGVDWKAVSHAFRAAYQVKHILTVGNYTYPLPETAFIKAVKSGQLSFQHSVGPQLEDLMDELEALSAKSELPEKSDRAFWDRWLLQALEKHV
jgi:predicted nucleotidyltransferase